MEFLLDLGRVEVIAEVRVNDQKIGSVWKAPYAMDITNAVQAGENQLQIEVTTLWQNRLIGDEYLPVENKYTKDNNIVELPDWYVNNQPKPGERKTFCVWHFYDKDAPLVESGILGPVKLIYAVEKQIKL